MENGGTGLPGGPAQQHAEEEPKPEQGPVPIQPQSTEVQLVWVQHQTSKTAPPRVVQLVNRCTTIPLFNPMLTAIFLYFKATDLFMFP